MATGLAGYGVLPLVLGDLLPDDVDVVAALGGLAVSAAAARLTGTARAVVLADAHGCRATLRMATWVPPAVTVADDGDCLSLQPLASFISIAKSVLKVKVLIVHALTNPYTPNAGAEPQAVVGRDDQLDSFDLLLARIERDARNSPCSSPDCAAWADGAARSVPHQVPESGLGRGRAGGQQARRQ